MKKHLEAIVSIITIVIIIIIIAIIIITIMSYTIPDNIKRIVEEKPTEVQNK
jgi:hypothetical protein